MFFIDPTKEYAKQTESRVVVRFQDCDPLNHLNNAKYFDYFFNAREDQVPKLYGVELKDLIKQFDAVWVVYNHHIAYLRSAMVGEWVKIVTRLIWYNEDTVVLEYLMMDDEKSHLKTLMWTTMKYVGLKTGKTVAHSEPILQYLEATKYGDVDYHAHEFDNRVKKVKEQVKLGF
ncbi:acyl-CoA thioester hydrolase [Roseivirga pacifica]|uniref:Acyl-CoA thioester hydrolase n=1 Tax=Roseivirga pacifica TaxID=1267423 RepID=A0A1I0QUJ7_9BACT|nr:acyl-CoA thioesterase [Roseivirga pacifica]MCO6357195.1 acyl-CoA thioesterase [Roseivirga pacifica]MCO6368091.1 acyl-CoA thioesterase [Roseivirga pacifica]MCO6369427.1 acyl-CoA thioesterase [Roseivirga pacifica]MCO6373281.1 acyl-CoA thioesterase [Roseivirga pacifica]MCO6377462.1 acyl-CoA thioesterase [Roseivirga pacifica]